MIRLLGYEPSFLLQNGKRCGGDKLDDDYENPAFAVSRHRMWCTLVSYHSDS